MALNDKTRKHNDMDFQKDLSEILTNAKIGLWAIEMDEGKEPRMYFDDVARDHWILRGYDTGGMLRTLVRANRGFCH